jgi:ribosomal-protein-alanine N-acetyltransferase
MADEAHLTNIAVRQNQRRQGISDLLMISVIELAQELKADYLTLEVRVSNTSAQMLYLKYGFTEVGRRKGYYTDNREDALIMSTESMKLPSFQQRLGDLKGAYRQKSGHLNDLVAWNHNQFISAKPPQPPCQGS